MYFIILIFVALVEVCTVVTSNKEELLMFRNPFNIVILLVLPFIMSTIILYILTADFYSM